MSRGAAFGSCRPDSRSASTGGSSPVAVGTSTSTATPPRWKPPGTAAPSRLSSAASRIRPPGRPSTSGSTGGALPRHAWKSAASIDAVTSGRDCAPLTAAAVSSARTPTRTTSGSGSSTTATVIRGSSACTTGSTTRPSSWCTVSSSRTESRKPTSASRWASSLSTAPRRAAGSPNHPGSGEPSRRMPRAVARSATAPKSVAVRVTTTTARADVGPWAST
jgi:hypothetical protein